MMRLLLAAIVWAATVCTVAAQNDSVRYDYTWYMGYNEYTSNPYTGTTVFDFNGDSVHVFSDDSSDIDCLETNVSISDRDGNFIFWSNGAYIFDATQSVMQNGDTLNPSPYMYDRYHTGLWVGQGMLALPHPGDDSRWHLFHQYILNYLHPEYGVVSPEILHSTIDMSLNGGLGAVDSKNETLIEGFFDSGNLTACRHANGRDWWLLIPERTSNVYHTLLLDPQGVHNRGTQVVGDSVYAGLSWTVFSPDGTHYVRYNGISTEVGSYVDIYDFDRCTGELSNQRHWNSEGTGMGSVVISPSSQYLYLTRWDTVFQFNLWAEDIIDSRTVVKIHDHVASPLTGFSTYFYMSMLGPDGKIYTAPSGSQETMHVMHHPDSAGVACDVELRALTLPHINLSMPNFPHYRLGRLEGSACDTVYNGTTPVVEVPGEGMGEVRIYPNPARELVYIDYTGDAVLTEVVLYDINGRRVARYDVSGQHSFSVAGLTPGVYLCHVRSSGEAIITRKLLVQ